MSVVTRKRLPGPERRARIVDAALEAFATNGYERTHLGAIAAAAGVSRPVLYDHFPSKKDLYLALVEEQYAQLLSMVAGSLTTGERPSVRARRFIDAFFEAVEARPFAWQMLLYQGTTDPEILAAHAEMQSGVRAETRALLAADMERSGIDPESAHAEAIVEITTSALHGLARWWYDHPQMSRAELTDITMDALWRGLARLGSQPPRASRHSTSSRSGARS